MFCEQNRKSKAILKRANTKAEPKIFKGCDRVGRGPVAFPFSFRVIFSRGASRFGGISLIVSLASGNDAPSSFRL